MEMTKFFRASRSASIWKADPYLHIGERIISRIVPAASCLRALFRWICTSHTYMTPGIRVHSSKPAFYPRCCTRFPSVYSHEKKLWPLISRQIFRYRFIMENVNCAYHGLPITFRWILQGFEGLMSLIISNVYNVSVNDSGFGGLFSKGLTQNENLSEWTIHVCTVIVYIVVIRWYFIYVIEWIMKVSAIYCEQYKISKA